MNTLIKLLTIWRRKTCSLLQAKDNNQSVFIIAEKSIVKEYKKVSGGAKAEPKDSAKAKDCTSGSESETEAVKGVVFVKTSSPKESIEKSYELKFTHNLTICHVNVKSVEHVEGEPVAEGEQAKR